MQIDKYSIYMNIYKNISLLQRINVVTYVYNGIQIMLIDREEKI